MVFNVDEVIEATQRDATAPFIRYQKPAVHALANGKLAGFDLFTETFHNLCIE